MDLLLYILELQKKLACASICVTQIRRNVRMMIEIDFSSDEAIYIQLTNQIIM